MLPLVSVTLLGASVSANMSNVVTPEGSGPPGPSVGHELLVISIVDLVFDLQLFCAHGTSGTRCSCNGPGDVLALPAYHTSPLFFVPPQDFPPVDHPTGQLDFEWHAIATEMSNGSTASEIANVVAQAS